MYYKKIIQIIVFSILLSAMLLAGCRSTQRMGMVRDQKTGLLYGSMMNGNIFMDPSQFDNPVIKLTIRNTSGDPAINLKAMRSYLENAYREKGYEITRKNKFSIHLDVNLRYSGQITQDTVNEVGFIGGVGGAYAGARVGKSADATVIGAASGASIGAIAGQYATQDTYIMIAEVGLGLVDKTAKRKKYVINFGDTQIKRHDEETGFTAYRAREAVQIAVYAGGDSTQQSKIVKGVSQRFKRILEDVI
ncbi:complement resistance protein TraT [Maridesulfovibrio zosterae]|uniref:complement resistance protein TraT n=1 Tax=Maridesulfovibrio zosterae TaxID=82171 RepID=UPI0003FCB66F|nr:complement resistance protein TraT [Maridesulfovibrio zosterae]